MAKHRVSLTDYELDCIVEALGFASVIHEDSDHRNPSKAHFVEALAAKLQEKIAVRNQDAP
jgi:hypothetical protein